MYTIYHESSGAIYALRLDQIYRITIEITEGPILDNIKRSIKYTDGYFLQIDLFNDKYIKLYYANKEVAEHILEEICERINAKK